MLEAIIVQTLEKAFHKKDDSHAFIAKLLIKEIEKRFLLIPVYEVSGQRGAVLTPEEMSRIESEVDSFVDYMLNALDEKDKK